MELNKLKRKPGRKPKINGDDALNIIKIKCKEIFNNDQSLKRITDKIWIELSNDLQNKLSSNTLYISIYQNRHKWQDILREECDFQRPILKNDKYNSDSSTSNSDIESGKQIFSFTIPYSKYSNIICATRYKRKQDTRLYHILKPYAWVDIINDAFIDHHNLPCNFIYKRAKVSSGDNINNKYFFTFHAKCKDCDQCIFGWCDEKPKTVEPMKICILAKDTRGENDTHSSKRPLMGAKRMKIGKELDSNIPSNWRRENTELMEFGCKSPPHLYKNNTLSKAKQEYSDSKLGINKNNIIDSLMELKHTSQAGSIHTIGCDPLLVHYWTNHQLLIYKDLNKGYCRLSIDATGSLVKKLKRTSLNLLSGDIFLYQTVINEGFGEFPVCQMVSERHDTITIAYWLDMWLRAGVCPPNEAICDYSKALLGAISRSFCKLDLRSYTLKCFRLIINQTNEIPICYIRIDVCHMIKNFCRLKCLNEFRNRRQKEFYIRGFRILLTSTNIEDFKKILKALMIIMLSPTDGWIDHNNFQPNPSEVNRLYIISLIKNIPDDSKIENNEETNIKNDSIDDEVNNLNNDPIVKFINQIESEIQFEASIEGDRDSAYYAPELIKHLKRYCYDFPLWTAVMKDYFKSPFIIATSASVESYFNELKNQILRFVARPLTADRFITRHIKSIDQSSKLFRSKQIRLQNEDVNVEPERSECDQCIYDKSSSELANYISEEEEEENDSSRDCENWRGKGTDPSASFQLNTVTLKKKRSTKYMEPSTEIERILNRSLRSKNSMLLINGNMKTPIKINKTRYLVTNTCAFDSVCTLITIAITDSKDYQKYIFKSTNKLLVFCKELALKGTSNDNYKERLEILKSIFKEDVGISGINIINAECNVMFILTNLLKDSPSATQMNICSDKTCVPKSYNSPTIIVRFSAAYQNLENDLEIYAQDRSFICSNCKSDAIGKIEVHEHLFIETDNNEQSCALTDIPIEIMVQLKSYILYGLVAYIPGHYIAYARRIGGRWENHNDLQKKFTRCENEKNVIVNPHVLMYALK